MGSHRVRVRYLGPDSAWESNRSPGRLLLPLDWGMPAGWLEAGDSIVWAGPRVAAGTNLEAAGSIPAEHAHGCSQAAWVRPTSRGIRS